MKNVAVFLLIFIFIIVFIFYSQLSDLLLLLLNTYLAKYVSVCRASTMLGSWNIKGNKNISLEIITCHSFLLATLRQSQSAVFFSSSYNPILYLKFTLNYKNLTDTIIVYKKT